MYTKTIFFWSIFASASQVFGLPINGSNDAIQAQQGRGPFFCSTVFNTVALKRPGYPKKIWDSLTSHGVKNWDGFLDVSLSLNDTIVPPYLQAANEPLIVQEPKFVQRGLELLKKPQPPKYLELYNEPDLDYHDSGATDAKKAATTLKPILDYNKQHNVSTFLSPALADPGKIYKSGEWLDNFDRACNGCVTSLEISIIGVHLYKLDPNEVIANLKKIHERWPKHKLWVTELAPSTHVLKNCQLSLKEVGDWMETVVTKAGALDYVQRIFWNSAEWRPKTDPVNDCIHSLTYPNGSATPLLTRYGQICQELM